MCLCIRRVVWLATSLALAGLVCRAAVAQELDELIRMRVEQLGANGVLYVDDAPIASANLIPRLYEARGFAPTWVRPSQLDSLLELIDEVALEGLDPADYHASAVLAARAEFAALDRMPPARRADLDLLLTDSVIRLGYHLRFGKVDPVMLDSAWNFSRELGDRDPVATIQAAIDAPSMREFAAAVIPRGVPYRRLKGALAEYRAIEAAGGWPTIPSGPTLKAGMVDPRVRTLIARLEATGDLDLAASSAGAYVDDYIYEGEVVAAVQRFQARHGLAADGAVGAATRAALNVPVAQRIAQLRVNLERARWVFRELEADYILVNIAGFHLDLVRAGETVWRTRVVVGQPYRKTPTFKATMRYLVFNPTWTIPTSIFRKDILPEVRRDPAYLAERNIDIIDRNGRLVDAASVDWLARELFPYEFVQRPGSRNALGQVKFMFPNEHSVYLHDTPSRDLFLREQRAFSSGCIRVENPLALAQALLGPDWDRARLEALIATGRTETVLLDNRITVMLLYSTAEVGDDGRVLFWSDIYDRDAAVQAQLDAPFERNGVL
jgi:murein L,D-transpeptidase YcbB/YkuD